MSRLHQAPSPDQSTASSPSAARRTPGPMGEAACCTAAEPSRVDQRVPSGQVSQSMPIMGAAEVTSRPSVTVNEAAAASMSQAAGNSTTCSPSGSMR